MDALGAMAIFLLRAQGRPLSPELIRRVALIAQADRFDFGPWPGVQSLPRTKAEWMAFAREPLGIAPISLLATDTKIALNERVQAIARWLETGEILAQYKNATEEKAQELASGFAEGSIAISVCLKGRLALVEHGVRPPIIESRHLERRRQCGAPVLAQEKFCQCPVARRAK